jgi:hypothetical protein
MMSLQCLRSLRPGLESLVQVKEDAAVTPVMCVLHLEYKRVEVIFRNLWSTKEPLGSGVLTIKICFPTLTTFV